MVNVWSVIVSCRFVSWPFPKQAVVFTCLLYRSFENTVGKGEIARNVFSSLYGHFSSFSLNLKLSSAKPLSLGEPKICRLGKGYYHQLIGQHLESVLVSDRSKALSPMLIVCLSSFFRTNCLPVFLSVHPSLSVSLSMYSCLLWNPLFLFLVIAIMTRRSLDRWVSATLS